MATFERISAEQALHDVNEKGTLLICGYDVEEKWENARVPGAINYLQFKAQSHDLPKESELIFYCA